MCMLVHTSLWFCAHACSAHTGQERVQMSWSWSYCGAELPHKDAKIPFLWNCLSRSQSCFSEAFGLKHILAIDAQFMYSVFL